ncbi:MAG: ribonucleoside-diphosphate reductase, adenosylcobalamin-dependent, partial [Alphaproteobacteria bacterium]
NRLGYCESIRATNPCGEQPLPPYGACLLGSINLAQLVDAPFTPRARLDHERLADAVTTAVRLLDDIIDVSRFPLPAQAAEAHAKRRMGLGVTGLASALVLCGQAYDSEAGRALADDWLAQLSRAAYLASADLAAEKGSFPLFDRDAHLARLEEQGVASDVREAVAAKGLRNGLLTSIAPTGTISLLAGNVSSGIEPVFSRSYRRRILESPGQARETVVEDFAWRLWRQTRTAAQPADPPGLVTAEDIAPADHVRMQAVAQRHIDSSISKTINVPRTMSFAAFKDVYLLAHELGCKGCTTYRPNDITGAVLTASPVDQDDADDPHAVPPPGTPPPIPPVATAVCPRCGEAAIQHLESCAVCAQCGFSACA